MNLNELPQVESAMDLSALFDEHGRCIPTGISAPAHRKTRRYFALVQPEIDHAAIHARTSRHLGNLNITPEEFARRAEAIRNNLQATPQTREILKGVGVPFLLPRATHADYGEALERVYIAAVHDAFAEKFPQYRFTNHHKDSLSGKLGIAAGSRHERLIQALQDGPVVGYYFPCLTEYSVPAALERMATLPSQFLLAGGFDTSAALVGSPNLLLRTDGYPPLLWMAALKTEKELVGYYYEAYGYNLTFNRRPHFGQAAEYWASGLVVLG